MDKSSTKFYTCGACYLQIQYFNSSPCPSSPSATTTFPPSLAPPRYTNSKMHRQRSSDVMMSNASFPSIVSLECVAGAGASPPSVVEGGGRQASLDSSWGSFLDGGGAGRRRFDRCCLRLLRTSNGTRGLQPTEALEDG